ncbi:MAG: ComEC/Rec2 family competence protein [Candidatus Falkowbacteria bacterium]
MPKSKIFLICCVSFIFGIAIASFLPENILKYNLLFFIAITFFSVILALFFKYNIIRLIALVGLFLFLGIWRYSISLPVNSPDKIWYYNGQTIDVVGVISNESDIRANNQKLEIDVKNKNISGKVLVTTNLYPKYNYGDAIEFTCELQAPERFSGFSYDRYLARYDIYSVCYYPHVSRNTYHISRNNFQDLFYRNIFVLKDKLREVINYGLGEPEASLAKAIILGDKKGIPEDLRDNFSRAGISHIIAISGMHISILAALVMGALLGIGLSRKKAFLFSSIFLIIYIMLIGLPASAMRAGLMGFLVLWALSIGRLNKITNSLVLAGAILLLINPRLLRDDIGFQLSFLAVLGIVYCYPIFNRWAEKWKIKKYFKIIFNIFAITMAAQVFTLPIITYNFNQVSVVAPIANLLILWTLPVLMILILIAIFLSLIFFDFAFIFFLPAMLLLKYIIIITEWLTKLPYAYFEVDYLSLVWVVVYYVVVGWGVWKIRKKYAK